MAKSIETNEVADSYLEICLWKWLKELKDKQITPADEYQVASGTFTYILHSEGEIFFPDPRVNGPCVTIVTPNTLSHLFPFARENLRGFVEKLIDLEPDKKAIVIGSSNRDRDMGSMKLLSGVLNHLTGKFTIGIKPQTIGGYTARRAVHLGSSAGVIECTGYDVKDVKFTPLKFPK